MCTTFVSRKSISFHFSPLSTTCYVYFSTCPSKWQGLNRKKIRKLRHRFFFRTHVSEFSVLIYICFYFHSYFTAPSPALFQSPSPTRYTDLRVCQAPHCSDKLCHMLPLCQYFDSAAVLPVQSAILCILIFYSLVPLLLTSLSFYVFHQQKANYFDRLNSTKNDVSVPKVPTREQQPTFAYNNRAGSRRIPPYYINTLFRINLLYPISRQR